MAGVKNRADAGLLADAPKNAEDSNTENSEKKRRKNREDLLNQKTKTMQMKSGNPSGFPGKI